MYIIAYFIFSRSYFWFIFYTNPEDTLVKILNFIHLILIFSWREKDYNASLYIFNSSTRREYKTNTYILLYWYSFF